MNKNIDWKAVFGSRNFLTAIGAIVAFALGANGVSEADMGGSVDTIFNLFTGKQGSELIIAAILYIINSGSRIYVALSGKKFDFSFLSNSNFQVTIISFVSVILGYVFNEQLAGYVIAIVSQIMNIAFNIWIKPKTVTEPKI